MEPIQFTKFTKAGGKPLTKTIEFVDGKPVKNSDHCYLSKGTAELCSIEGLAQMPDIIGTLTTSQALGLGIPKRLNGSDGIDIVTRAALGDRVDAISRTQEYFRYPPRSLMLFDHDRNDHSVITVQSAEEFIGHLGTVDPQWNDIEYVHTVSTSSAIYRGDEELVKPEGFHLYTAGDGDKINDYARALYMKSFIDGMGYIALSVDGKMLDRSIFDRFVFAPERLIFEAGAVLKGDLEQRRPDAVHVEGNTLNLKALKPTVRRKEEFESVKHTLCRAIEPEAARIRAAYIAMRTDQLHEVLSGEVSLDDCRRLVLASVSNELHNDFLLQFDHMQDPVAVRDVLADMAEFEGRTLRDPLELEAGRNKAYVRDGKIHSHLHGGRKFTLHEGSRPRPHIMIVDSLIDEQVAELEQAIALGGTNIYCRGDILVRPGIEVNEYEASLYELNPVNFVTQATREMRFSTYDKHFNEKRINCPGALARHFLEEKGHWANVPKVMAVSNTPLMGPDGRVIQAEGYDAETGLLMRNVLQVGPIPDKPTAREVGFAKDQITVPFAEFPFVSDDDRAVIYDFKFSLMQRALLMTVPMKGFSALAPGTGKGKVIQAGAAGVTGQHVVTRTMGADTEEMEKRIGTVMAKGSVLVSIDNVTRPLGGDLLCSITTEPLVAVRLLGHSKEVMVYNRSVLTATGQNLTITGELSRRCVVGMMDAGMERPEQRTGWTIDPLVPYCLAHRAEIVRAMLILQRAYYVAGKPASGLPPLGSFEGWSREIRDMLIWLDLGDPVVTQERLHAENPEVDERRRMFALMHEVFPPEQFPKGFTAARLAERVEGTVISIPHEGPLQDFKRDAAFEEESKRQLEVLNRAKEAIEELFGHGSANAKVLGNWLRDNRNRTADGLRLWTMGRSKVGRRYLVQDALAKAPAGAKG